MPIGTMFYLFLIPIQSQSLSYFNAQITVHVLGIVVLHLSELSVILFLYAYVYQNLSEILESIESLVLLSQLNVKNSLCDNIASENKKTHR